MKQIATMEHEVWNKERIEQQIFEYPSRFVVMNDYQMSFDTMIMFNFASNPLNGEFKSVIFDDELGMVLCQESTKTLTRNLAKSQYFNFGHSRVVEEMIGAYEHHSLCFGSYCFVALDTYLKRNTDWVALHWMTEMNFVDESTLFSDSNGVKFQFDQSYRKVKDATYSAVSVNYLLQQEIYKNHCLIDFNEKTPDKSIMNNDDYIPSSVHFLEVNPNEIARRLLDHEVDCLGMVYSREFETIVDDVCQINARGAVKTFSYNW